MSLYIFLLYYIYHLCFTCIDFYDLSAWGGCWFVVYIRRFIYKFLNVCPLITRLLRLVGRWARKPVNHTSWVAVVTPTDRPKSVRNRCVIELFCGVVYVVTLPFWHFCWCMGFCHRTESDLFLFFFQLTTFLLIPHCSFLWFHAISRIMEQHNNYKCYYCLDKCAKFADGVKHCVGNHTNHVLRYRKLLLDDKSEMMKYQTQRTLISCFLSSFVVFRSEKSKMWKVNDGRMTTRGHYSALESSNIGEFSFLLFVCLL